MSIEQLPALLVSIFAVGYTPGPANVYAMSCAISYGPRKSMKMWLGLLCGFSCAALVAAVAVCMADMAFGEYVLYIRYVAVTYILYLSWKTFKGGVSEAGGAEPGFFNGFVVQFTNVKIILFDLSCYSIYVLPDMDGFADFLPVASLLLLAGPVANLVWLLAGTVLRPFVITHMKAVSCIMSLILLLCAVSLFIAF